MKIIVTGGCGFIGKAVCKALASAGHIALSFDREGFPNILKSIVSPSLLEIFDFYGAEAVIHLAALTSYPCSVDDMAEINIQGTRNVIEACRNAKVKKLIFASSCAVYGANAGDLMDEDDDCAPLTVYGMTKRLGELLVQQSGLDYVIFRMFNVAGAGCDHKPPRYVISRAIEAAANTGFILKCYGDLTDERDYVHVDDVADAYVKALDPAVKNEIFNIGSGHGTLLEEIIRQVSLYMGNPVSFAMDAAAQGLNSGVANISADISKAVDKLKWKPARNTGDCIVDAVDYYKQNLKQEAV
jgi:UDP-glucose 4-epimerase